MKTICVIESPENLQAYLQHRGFESSEPELYCTCSEAKSELEKLGLKYTYVSEDLFAEKWDRVNAWAKKASLNWFREMPFDKTLTVNELNLGDLCNRPISHALIYAYKNQYLAAYLQEHVSFDRIIVFENREKKGRNWKFERGSVNHLLFQWSQAESKKILGPIQSRRDADRNSFLKESLRGLIGFFYNLTHSFKKTNRSTYVGMGSLKYFVNLLETLAREGDAFFVDVSFQAKAYKICKAHHIKYRLRESLVPLDQRVGMQRQVLALNKTIQSLQEKIKSSSHFIFENCELHEIGHLIVDILTENAYFRLLQSLQVKSLAKKYQAKSLILHEDIDVFRGAAVAAKQNGLKGVVLSHGVPPAKDDWSKAARGVAVAETIVNSTFERDKYLKIGNDLNSLHVLGLPRFDEIFNRSQAKKRAVEQRKKTVLYCPHMLTRITKRKKAYLGIHTMSGVTRQNSIELLKACNDLDCQLVVKPHGNSRDIELWEALVREYGNERTSLADHHADIFDLIEDSDLVVSTFSTVVIEAMLFGKNAVTLNFTGRPDIHSYAQRGIALGVYEASELKDSIRNCLFDPGMQAKLAEAREREWDYFGGPFDGKNTKRVIQFLSGNLEVKQEDLYETVEISG